MAKNEAKIKFTAETGGFNDAIKKSNDTMSQLRAEMKLNDTQMKGTGATVEGLEKKHELLSNQLQASQDKTEALNQKVQRAVEIFGEDSAEVAKLKIQLTNAQTAEERLRQAVSQCADEVQAQKDAMNQTKSTTEQLTDSIDEQQSEVDRLKKEYDEATLEFGDASDEAQDLARRIQDLSGELNDNKTKLSQAKSKADDLDKSLDNAGDSAEDAGDGFTIMKGVVADLASNAIQAAIGKISEFVGWLAQLPTETMELRQNMSTLATSFDKAGFSTETATNTWKELYSVFGDDATAVEASNHIARLSSTQEDLSKWTNIVTGLYGEYQDAINPAAIMESAKETAVVGKVTGQFADALNWSSEAMKMFSGYMNEDVKTAEDAFNVALSECNTEQERQALITETLTALYGDSAQTYRDTASAQMEAKEATAEQMLANNNLATALEPVTTAWQEMKNEMLEGILPTIEKVSGAMTDALAWMQEHPVAMKIIASVIGVVAAAITALTIVVVAWTVAQWALNSAILANPLTWIIVAIVAAIAAVVAIIVLVIEYWDEIVAAVKRCVAWICEAWNGFVTWIDTYLIQPIKQFFQGLWDGIKAIWDGIVNAIKFAFDLIVSIVSAYFQLITLPFRFIWENCKEYVFAAFEWIKNAIKTASEWISNLVATIWGWIRDNIVNPIVEVYHKAVEIFENIKSAISEKITAIKDKATEIFLKVKEAIQKPINEAKEKVSSIIDSLRTAIQSKIESIKTKVSAVFTNIKEAMQKPIDAAKEKIRGIIDTIKGFFTGLKLKFPNISLPHFSISPKGWKIGDLLKGSIPKLSIAWHADGVIFTKPTLIGSGNSVHGVGEAGAEAVLPIDRLEGYIENAIERTQQVVNFDNLANAIDRLADRAIELRINDRVIAEATASAHDNVNGLRNTLKGRGLVLE